MLFISFILTALFSASLAESTDITLDVYYESLCPDSQKFIVDELAPVWESSLKNKITLTLVPFGRAVVSEDDGNYTFTCSHGPVECYGDKVQACALKKLSSMDQKVKFIICTMKNSNKKISEQDYPMEKCLKEINISSPDDIRTCVNSTEADTELKSLGDITKKYPKPVTSVPLVVLNKNETLAGSKDLKGKLCSLLNNSVSECQEPSKGSASFTAAPFITLIAGFLLSKVV